MTARLDWSPQQDAALAAMRRRFVVIAILVFLTIAALSISAYLANDQAGRASDLLAVGQTREQVLERDLIRELCVQKWLAIQLSNAWEYIGHKIDFEQLQARDRAALIAKREECGAEGKS